MIQYDPVRTGTKAIPNKELPLYATYKPSRKPNIKYQSRGEAKNALRWCISEGSGFRAGGNNFATITVYKWGNDSYGPIFDSNSELADAFRQNKITEDELFNLIDW